MCEKNKEKRKKARLQGETERDTAQEKKHGGYGEGELPVAIATAGTLVQSPRRCVVARERF